MEKNKLERKVNAFYGSLLLTMILLTAVFCWWMFKVDNHIATLKENSSTSGFLNFIKNHNAEYPLIVSNDHIESDPQTGEIWIVTDLDSSFYGDEVKVQRVWDDGDISYSSYGLFHTGKSFSLKMDDFKKMCDKRKDPEVESELLIQDN